MSEAIGRMAPGAVERPTSATEAAPSPELQKAAEQFESLLLHMMIKSMRDSVPRTDLFGDAAGRETYEMMRDQEMAKSMAEGGGVGFARMIVSQFAGREEEGLEALSRMSQRLDRAADSYQNYGEAPAGAPLPLDRDGGVR